MTSVIRSIKSIAFGAGSLAVAAAVQAAPVYYSFGLHGGPLGGLPTPFISFVQAPVDSNADGWSETVMRINLRDPALSNPYNFAQFRISYDGAPTGLSVNIGDSATNNGGSGDSGTQSNDAELQIGGLVGGPASAFPTLQVFGNDQAPPASKVLADVAGFADPLNDVFLTVGDGFAAWDNGAGQAGSVSSPYLFALNGQADAEGSVNYDIFASFNRVIDGNYRIGSGVGMVTVCLSEDASCFQTVPLPGSLPLSGLGLLLAGVATAQRRRSPRIAADSSSTGMSPTATIASDGSAASPRRSSRAKL